MELNVGGVKPPFPSAKLKDKHIFLASNSPRRRELLAMIVPEYSVIHGKDIDESYRSEMRATDVPEYLSKKKAAAYASEMGSDDVIIAADTVVIIDGNILGKPADRAEACRMLRKLSGKTHTVVTGVTLVWMDNGQQCRCSFSEHTDVTFGELTDDEIREYVSRYSPLDKAGAYGIQEWTGAAIERINGCFYNVMGLPIHRLYQVMKTV